MSFVKVENLVKEFAISKNGKGLANNIKSLFKREYTVKRAVDDISFSIQKGELVGYIGSNGAGKSTTIKMLTGILTPTSGSVMVDGRVPYENRRLNSMHIGVVFGQRSQLYWDLPMSDTFELYKKMYKINDSTYKRNVEFYVELLDMKEFFERPIRMLSLGQKMRANIAIALLHNPEILYLDEPTIGLDIIAKGKIRKFIKEINRERNITVMLTTHDMRDIEEICSRIIMIDKGKIIYDGVLNDFKLDYSQGQVVEAVFSDGEVCFENPFVRLLSDEGLKKSYVFKKNDISSVEVIDALLKSGKVTDLSLKEPDIEEIIKGFYASKQGIFDIGSSKMKEAMQK